jgi:hypothetical protein
MDRFFWYVKKIESGFHVEGSFLFQQIAIIKVCSSFSSTVFSLCKFGIHLICILDVALSAPEIFFPWEYAYVVFTPTSIVLHLTNESTLGFINNQAAYIEEFGEEKGRLLFTEFDNILSHKANRRTCGDDLQMEVYVSIWRVFGKSWTEKIKRIKTRRKIAPPKCNKHLF